MTNFLCWWTIELALATKLSLDAMEVRVHLKDRQAKKKGGGGRGWRHSFVVYVGCSVYPGGIWIGAFPHIPEQLIVVAAFFFCDWFTCSSVSFSLCDSSSSLRLQQFCFTFFFKLLFSAHKAISLEAKQRWDYTHTGYRGHDLS